MTISYSGSNIDDQVISYTREQSICSGVGTLTLVLTNTTDIDAKSTYDIITVTEDGHKKGEYYVITYNKNLPDATITVECQDASILLVDHFIEDQYNTADTAYLCSYWIDKFLSESSVSYTFDTYEDDSLLSNNSFLGLCSAYDAIMPLLAQCGWYMYFDENNTCHINRISNSLDSVTVTAEDIQSVKSHQHDKFLRNRAVVWGSGSTFTGDYVFADLRINTPWDYDANDVRTILIANPNIPDNNVAYQIAKQLLDEFAKISNEVTVEYIGFIDIGIGDNLTISTKYGKYFGIIMTLVSHVATNGIITEMTIGQRCPRLVGYYNFNADYVYVATSGEGVWRKPLKGPHTWEDYSTGIDYTNVTDLAIDKGTFACVVDKQLYTRHLSDGYWTEVGSTTVSGEFTISGEAVEYQACTIDPITNDVYSIINVKDTYFETMGVASVGSNAKTWLSKTTNTGISTLYPITVSGQDSLYSYDIDTDGKNKYISVIPLIPFSSTEIKTLDESYVETYTLDGRATTPDCDLAIQIGKYESPGILRIADTTGDPQYYNNTHTVTFVFRLDYTGPNDLVRLEINYNHAGTHSGAGDLLYDMGMWTIGQDYCMDDDDGIYNGIGPFNYLPTVRSWSLPGAPFPINQETTVVGEYFIIQPNETRWLLFKITDWRDAGGAGTPQNFTSENIIQILSLRYRSAIGIYYDLALPAVSNYGVLKTSDNTNFSLVTTTPNPAKIELSKGSPLVLYGGNEWSNGGFVYYSKDGITFNNLNLFATGVNGNPSLDGAGFVSDARSFDVITTSGEITVSGETFNRYTGIVQHNEYNGVSNIRLARYDLNPVWQSPALIDSFTVSGELDKMETTNQGYRHTPYLFFSTITPSGEITVSGEYSEFYQIDYDKDIMNKYMNGLPHTRINSIRCDEKI